MVAVVEQGDGGHRVNLEVRTQEEEEEALTVGWNAVAEGALQGWLFCALSIAPVERSQTRTLVSSVLLISRPRLQAAMLPQLAVVTQATGAMQAHQEEPAPRVGRVHTGRLQATSHARIVHLSRPLLLAAPLYLLVVAMQAMGATQAHQEEPASYVVLGSTRRRRAT